MDRWIIPAMSGVIGAVIGALVAGAVTYFVNIAVTQKQYLEESRRNAYADFLRVQEKYILAYETPGGKPNEALLEDYYTETASARKRIAIYGSRPVVEAMAQFYRHLLNENRKEKKNGKLGMCIGSKQRWERDVKMYRLMRGDLMPGSNQQVNDPDLVMVLFRCDTKDVLGTEKVAS